VSPGLWVGMRLSAAATMFGWAIAIVSDVPTGEAIVAAWLVMLGLGLIVWACASFANSVIDLILGDDDEEMPL
jgi:hypothetical protein